MRSKLAVRSYILFQLDFLQEEELRRRLRSWRVNVDGEAPLGNDPVCPSFRLAGQGYSRLGGRLRQNHHTLVSDL